MKNTCNNTEESQNPEKQPTLAVGKQSNGKSRMKTTSANKHSTPSEASSKTTAAKRNSKIHPVVIYPFRQPGDYSDLEPLYEMIEKLDTEKEKYARPITVMDRKTSHAMEGNKAFLEFRRGTIAKHSDVLDAWCVDTCQMWYLGLGAAIDKGESDDAYWLIPGDFNYGTRAGKEVLAQLRHLPEAVCGKEQDLCIGEITMNTESSKQVIDTYGTFALLYNWFPFEARKIRQLTERPRSEFFAIGHGFLHEVLRQRWFAYEQTMVMLLLAVFSNKHVGRLSVGDISDLPLGTESLASAIMQIERTERVLKTFWLERNQAMAGLAENYRALAARSEQVHRAAEILLQNMLG
jgi:hypothetical protein